MFAMHPLKEWGEAGRMVCDLWRRDMRTRCYRSPFIIAPVQGIIIPFGLFTARMMDPRPPRVPRFA